MNKALKRRGGAIIIATVLGAGIGCFFAAPLSGALIAAGISAGALLLLAKLPIGPM